MEIPPKEYLLMRESAWSSRLEIFFAGMVSLAVAVVIIFAMGPIVPDTVWYVELPIILSVVTFSLTLSIVLIPFLFYQIGIGVKS
ncbi:MULTISPECIES: hypothetical protein [Halomicrobium]|uniref:Uncharacterized protein n=2 Tax=Halomicrobium mukohataei TaxID=57705 RepID=C7P259_HALMD|nr:MULTISPECIES: hypothetical protein [Halomicrobium]ACV47288.1 hypothetical protein Hmuk_1162 [Halomicrobium mukohataei DSM 12286]QCD65758.1 hypothetical protein E5139_08985 [Halomicrobium mukohataei]QFR20563.1 hypothetical protein GBQ70_08980 [Halomicrobium sp. ZPS1]